MTGGITYDNVASEDGGNVFRGISFWVAQRVPMRNTLLKELIDNGGSVVKLEREAHMLIADDLRLKDAPLTSYSYKYIIDSVKNGYAQVPDRYRIHPDPEDARPVAGYGPKKGTRTPYSKADDAQLAAWVLDRRANREGNEIYKELEAVNPRHTWQSWRDRWVKKLRKLSIEDLERLALWKGNEEASAAPKLGANGATGTSRASAGPAKPVQPRPRAQMVAPTEKNTVAKSRRTAQQTGEADVDKDDEDEDDAFEPAAVPRHLRSTPPKPMESQSSIGNGRSKDIATQIPLDIQEDDDADDDSAADEELLSKVRQSLSGPSKSAAPPAPSKSKFGGKVIARPDVGDVAMTGDESSEEFVQSAQEDGQKEQGEEDEAPGGEEADASQDQRTDQFYKDLIAFEGVKAEDFTEGVLEGPECLYEIRLYDLLHAVAAESLDSEELSWDNIADRLDLDTAANPWAPAALEKCYNERLKEFWEVINEESGESQEVGDETQIRHQLQEEAELPAMGKDLPDEEAEDEVMVASPIPLDPADDPWALAGDIPERVESAASARKRRQRSRDAEIPSTPDVKRKGRGREKRQHPGDSEKAEQESAIRPRPIKRRLRNQIEYEVPAQWSARTTRNEEPEISDSSRVATQQDDKLKGKQSGTEIPDTYEDEDEDNYEDAVEDLAQGLLGSSHDSDDVFGGGDAGPATDDEDEDVQMPKPRRAVKRKLPFDTSSHRRLNPESPSNAPNLQSQSTPSFARNPEITPRRRNPLAPDQGLESSIRLLIDRREARPFKNTAELQAFVSTTLGYPPDLTAQAIHATSTMPSHSLIHCVHSLYAQGVLPQNFEGIWTPRDDDWLRDIQHYDFTREPSGPRELKIHAYRKKQRARLVKKHLQMGVKVRDGYLQREAAAFEAEKRARDVREARALAYTESRTNTVKWIATGRR